MAKTPICATLRRYDALKKKCIAVHAACGPKDLNLPEDTKTHKRDLDDRSLNSQQMRFVELVIDELSASGFIEPNALYESPFNSLHADGPEGLFAGKNNINDGLSQKLEQTQQRVMEG